jgi:RHS repeat-associated protein
VPTGTELSELCYQYKYDKRNRLIRKKIPGKDWEYIVYDQLDRPVLTQAGLGRTKSPDEWLFTKYDALGRVAYTGIYRTNSLRAALQSQFDNKTAAQNYEDKVSSGTGFAGTYYTNNDYPTGITASDILTVNYYDNYTFNRAGAATSVNSYGVASSTNAKGLATGTRVKVLGVSPEKWITTVIYYDNKARVIYSYIKNDYLSTTEILKSKLDFTGRILETTAQHTKSGQATITTVDAFAYDHVGRVTKQTQMINGQVANTELIAENQYDELGQLVSKGVGNLASNTTQRLQTIDYTYNVRGWLKTINQDSNNDNDLFNFTLMYDDIADVNKRLYNGNISQTSWNTLNTDSSTKTYTYTYDALNRITSAIDNTSNQHYSLTNVSYDKNGNIQNLLRNGHIDVAVTNFGTMDNLSYYYNGNQLHSVTDSSGKVTGFNDGNSSDAVYDNGNDDYSYDVNGNLLSDANKGITSILYNHLNLPTQVTINGQHIDYVYDAEGTKLRKAVNSTTTDYAGDYVYENNVLQFFNHPEGYVTPDGSSFKYVYQYKDHLDNIRLSYSDDDGNGTIAQSEIIEENNYYPFGLKHKGYNTYVSSSGNSVAQKRKFGGNELQEELNLNWYDITARNYDPALGRWMNIDPLAQKMPTHSPYNYAFNNPINFIDEDGEAPIPAWVIRTVVVNVIKIATKVTIGRKIAKADKQLQNVKSEISSKTTEINKIKNPGLYGDGDGSGGFNKSFGGGKFGGGGAGGSYGTPMTQEERAEEKQRQDDAFKESNPEGFEKVKTLEGEISALDDKANGLEKKIDGLMKTEKLLKATDPNKIVKEVSEEIGLTVFQLVDAVKKKINQDVENRRKKEEEQK